MNCRRRWDPISPKRVDELSSSMARTGTWSLEFQMP